MGERASPRRAAGLVTALLLATSGAHPAWAGSVVDGILARMTALPAREARFVEHKLLSSLTEPLVSRGRLVFRPPGHLEKDTESPFRERLVIDGDTLTIAQAEAPPRTVPLDAQPALRALADTLRAALAGDLATLRRLYAVEEQGTAATWRLLLVPDRPGLRRVLARVTIDGGGIDLQQIDIQQTNGDEQRITMQAASPAAPLAAP